MGFYLDAIVLQCLDSVVVRWFIECAYLEPFHCDDRACSWDSKEMF